MTPLAAVQALVVEYLEGKIDLRQLDDGVDDLLLTQIPGDPTALALAGRVSRLVAEYGYGHRSETSIKQALRRALSVAAQESATRVPPVTNVNTPATHITAMPANPASKNPKDSAAVRAGRRRGLQDNPTRAAKLSTDRTRETPSN